MKAGDDIESIAQEIIQTCYLHLETIPKSTASDEILLLLEYLKPLAPRISAGGLFDVNKKLIYGFFSISTSYFILLIQFRNMK